MRHLSIIAGLGLLTISLSGCDSSSEVSTLESALNTAESSSEENQMETTTEATNVSGDVEVTTDATTSVEAVDRTATATETEVVVENQVIGQETPIGDNPVMNPAGETLIQTAQVTFPDGGERIEVGKTYEIRWESEGIKALNLEVHQFGRKIDTLAERVLAVEGGYSWIPDGTLLRGNDFAQLTIVLVDADTGVTHGGSADAFMLLPQE